MFTSFMVDYMSNSNKGAADPTEMFAQFMAKQAKEREHKRGSEATVEFEAAWRRTQPSRRGLRRPGW